MVFIIFNLFHMANFEILHMIILKRTCEIKFVLKKKNMSNLTQKRCIKESKKNHIQIFDGVVYYLIKINGNAVISNAFIQIFPIKINILE